MKKIDHSPDRFNASAELLKTFTVAELKRLESLIITELNARALKEKPLHWLLRMLSK